MKSETFTFALSISTVLSVVSAERYANNVFRRNQEPSRPSCSNFTSFAYAGCFSDLSSPRSLLFSGPSNQNMTVETCVAFCKGNDYKYAGLEYYKECFCGASVNGPQVNESSCNYPCTGDKTETCGANNYMNIYQDTTFPVVNQSTIADYMAMGCYSEGSMGRSLAWKQSQLNSNAMTVETCLTACKGGGYSFGGLEFGKECYCGVVLGNGTSPLNSTSCNIPCTGNGAETCGGKSTLNLYVAKDLESTQPCNGGGKDGDLSSSSGVIPSTPTPLSSSSSQSISTTGISTTPSVSIQDTSPSSSNLQNTTSSQSTTASSLQTSTTSSILSSNSHTSSFTDISTDEPVFTSNSRTSTPCDNDITPPSRPSPTSSSTSSTSGTISSVIISPIPSSSSSSTTSSESSSIVQQSTSSSTSIFSSSSRQSTSSSIPSSPTSCPPMFSPSTTYTPPSLPLSASFPPISSPSTTYKPPVPSNTKTTASLCTSTIISSPRPTCEYKCGNWCSTPIPAFSDFQTCFTAFSSCMVQLSGCFLQAGFPDSTDCFQFSDWCTSISSYCTNYCPGPNCYVGGCKSKYPPPGPVLPPPTTYTAVYTCPPPAPTSSKTPTSMIKPSSTTCVPIPTNSNICKQPSNPWSGYDIDNPVGGIPLPCLTCNNLYSDYNSGNCFKLYVDPNTSNCPSYPRYGDSGPVQGCKDACDSQYNSCMDTYAEGCRQRKRSGSDDYGSASQKCMKQWNDCYAVNAGVSVGLGRCGSYNSGWW